MFDPLSRLMYFRKANFFRFSSYLLKVHDREIPKEYLERNYISYVDVN